MSTVDRETQVRQPLKESLMVDEGGNWCLYLPQVLQSGLTIAAVSGLGVSADALLIEPNHPVLNRVDIHLRRLPDVFDGFTIAQLSDFHYDPEFSAKPIRVAVEMVNQLRPNLVVPTGDFVTEPFLGHRLHRNMKKAAETAEPCGDLLNKLRAEFGVMSVIGNHDETHPTG